MGLDPFLSRLTLAVDNGLGEGLEGLLSHRIRQGFKDGNGLSCPLIGNLPGLLGDRVGPKSLKGSL